MNQIVNDLGLDRNIEANVNILNLIDSTKKVVVIVIVVVIVVVIVEGWDRCRLSWDFLADIHGGFFAFKRMQLGLGQQSSISTRLQETQR